VTGALKLDASGPLRAEAFYDARRRLYETGAFRQVDIETGPIGVPEPTGPGGVMQQPMGARISLEEWPLWRLGYGVQVNDLPDPVGDGRNLGPGFSTVLERSNLFGRAATIGTALRYDTDRQAVRTYFSSPRLFGLPVTSTFFVQREWERVAGLLNRATRVSFEQRYRLRRAIQVNYGYFYRRVQAEVPPLFGQPLPDAVLNNSGLYSAVSFDRRDDPFDTRRGWFHASSVEYAAKILGSDVRFVKSVSQQALYWTAGRQVVLAWNGRIGLADGFDQPLTGPERFHAGGHGTVRGYAEDSLSPLDELGLRAGGEALLVFNHEVRFPIWRRLRGVGFLDAGNTFAEPTQMELGDLELGAGFGLRVGTPIGVLRFDFGVPVSRDASFGAGRLHFSFGQVF
jgi:outer membrane protein insertion porin family